MTRVEIALLTPNGKYYPGAIIYYMDAGQIKTIMTDGQGKASVLVRGCVVTFFASVTPKFHHINRKIHLEFNNDKSVNVVLSLKNKCNFQIWFQQSGGDDDSEGDQYTDIVHYMYSTASGGNGEGFINGGEMVVPLCIYVDVTNPDEKLKFLATRAAGGNTINQLDVSHFDKGKQNLTKCHD